MSVHSDWMCHCIDDPNVTILLCVSLLLFIRNVPSVKKTKRYQSVEGSATWVLSLE